MLILNKHILQNKNHRNYKRDIERSGKIINFINSTHVVGFL